MHYVRYGCAQTAQLMRKAEQSYRKLKKECCTIYIFIWSSLGPSGSSRRAQSWQLPCRGPTGRHRAGGAARSAIERVRAVAVGPIDTQRRRCRSVSPHLWHRFVKVVQYRAGTSQFAQHTSSLTTATRNLVPASNHIHWQLNLTRL